MSSEPIRLALFEDNHHLRESLYYIFNGTPGFTCTGSFPDCSDIEFRIRQSNPDVVLMDIEMPGMSGIDGAKIIKQNFPGIQVLMQTVFDDDENIFRAICAGASGYILKSATPTELLQAVQDTFHGGSPMSPSIARRVLTRFQQMSPSGQQEYGLTPREKEILSMLVAGKSYKMIALACGIVYETVRFHMKHIYEKLHVESMTEAVAKAMKERIV